MKRAVMLLMIVLAASAAALSARAGGAEAASGPIPVLAYYYIWFDTTSWERAKRDHPLLGNYSSDEKRIMRQHIRWAKKSGIDGFIVSWKSTWRLNGRLENLMRIAAEEKFKLVMIYQGLDFQRDPLPVHQIEADLKFFATQYAADPVFDLFDKPVMIWSGTWKFRAADIARVSAMARKTMLVLATERDIAGYERVRQAVDGNAYYWSSVDPLKYKSFGDKLIEMGRVIHDRHGLWIAPAAPGFDARLVGGITEVLRRDGETLRRRMDAAAQSSPDAIGVISWNEFSENTHIEPSRLYGSRYLKVLADITGASFTVSGDLDSSDVGTARRPAIGLPYGLPLLGGILVVGLAVLFATLRQRHRRHAASHEHGDDPGGPDSGYPDEPGPGSRSLHVVPPASGVTRHDRDAPLDAYLDFGDDSDLEEDGEFTTGYAWTRAGSGRRAQHLPGTPVAARQSESPASRVAESGMFTSLSAALALVLRRNTRSDDTRSDDRGPQPVPARPNQGEIPQ